jgi:CxxC-x17-CxxC domain-containing protein
VLNAVLGNVGTIVSFRVGAMDTEILEKEFEPTFYANDLVNLDKYNIYLKLMIDGVATRPFSAKTLLPIDVSDTIKNVDKVIKASRDKYANNRATVEKRIMDWSGMKNPEVAQNIKSFAQQVVELEKEGVGSSDDRQENEVGRVSQNNLKTKIKERTKKQLKSGNDNGQNGVASRGDDLINAVQIGIGEEGVTEVGKKKDYNKQSDKMVSEFDGEVKEKQEKVVGQGESDKKNKKQKKSGQDKDVLQVVNCSGCGVETEINFIPDGIRPVFCRDCLKEYRREQAKLQNSLQKQQSSSAKKKRNSNKDNGEKGGNIKIIKNNKKQSRVQVDSEAIQDLIKKAMEDNG